MKKMNAKIAKRVGAIVLAVVAAFSVMGCSVEKTVTTTETHTDADGNTTGSTTTTTTTNKDGQVTTETTTETINEVADSGEELAGFENVPLTISNEMGWDVGGLYIKMSSSDEWSDNFLGEDMWLDDGTNVHGITVSYNEDNRFVDINVVDSTGEGVEFEHIELPAEEVDEILISLEYDEADGTFNACVVE